VGQVGALADSRTPDKEVEELARRFAWRVMPDIWVHSQGHVLHVSVILAKQLDVLPRGHCDSFKLMEGLPERGG